MIQNSVFKRIFTRIFKRIDEQNGSLHQHKSTFVVIGYYQDFKTSFFEAGFVRIYKETQRAFWVDFTSRSSKWRPRHAPEADFNKIYDKPAHKAKKQVLQTQYIQQIVHTYNKLLNNQSKKASICAFFVLHQWLL